MIGTATSASGATAENLSIPDSDWTRMGADLDERGYAVIANILAPKECRNTAQLYSDDARFRSRVVMARHGFGRGEYKYFRYPLPDVVARLRQALYPPLAEIATRWSRELGVAHGFPARHSDFLQLCHEAGQTQPTALLLQYQPGDYNCLHQDLYGDLVFPLQAAILLSEPGCDFTGGEFVLTEQRPRMQSRAAVVALRQGDAVVFAVSHRPAHGTRGFHRVNMRHGVSEVLSGQRHVLGVIFHDAR